MSRLALFLLAGLSVAVAPATPSIAAAPDAAQPASRDPYGLIIAEAVQRFGVPDLWIRTIMRAESGGDPRAVSAKGAMGLMQLMPATWTYLRQRYGLGGDPFDPHDNVIGGAALIRALFDRYGSPGWIAAYNAGAGRYEAGLKGRPLPTETRLYIVDIARRIGIDPGTAPTVVAAVDPLAWTRAPLFVAQADVASAVAQVPADRATAGAPSLPDGPRASSVDRGDRPVDGLFVARTMRRSDR